MYTCVVVASYLIIIISFLVSGQEGQDNIFLVLNSYCLINSSR